MTALAVVISSCDDQPPRSAASRTPTTASPGGRTTPAPASPTKNWSQLLAVSPTPAAVISVGQAQPARPHLSGLRRTVMGEQPRTGNMGVRAYLDDGISAVGVWTARCPQNDPDWIVRACKGSIGLLRDGHYRAFAQAGRDPAGPFRGQQRQITDLAAGEGYVVWVETPSTDMDGNEWTIRAWHQSTGRITEVAHSRYLRKGHRYAGYAGSIVPVVLGGQAYWPSPVPTSDHPGDDNPKDWSFRVLSAPLSGGGPTRTIATDAAFAAVVDGSLFYATHESRGKRHIAYLIHRRERGVGPDTVVARGAIAGMSDLTNVAGGNHLLAWTTSAPDVQQGWMPGESTPGRVYLMDLRTSRVTELVTADEAGANYSFAFGPDRLLWGNGSGNGDAGQYLFQPSRNALYRLGTTQGGAMVVSAPIGSAIRWSNHCDTPKHRTRYCDYSAAWKP